MDRERLLENKNENVGHLFRCKGANLTITLSSALSPFLWLDILIFLVIFLTKMIRFDIYLLVFPLLWFNNAILLEFFLVLLIFML